MSGVNSSFAVFNIAKRRRIRKTSSENIKQIRKLAADLQRQVTRLTSEHSFGRDVYLNLRPEHRLDLHVLGNRLSQPLRDLHEPVQLFCFKCHCSSPVVADAEADTSVDPALTVQEGTDIQSPGVGVAGACRCAVPADSSGGAR